MQKSAPPEEKTPPAIVDETGVAWLGLNVSKPDDTITSQLPLLPPGIGFVVNVIEEGGPADKAGVRKLDLFWKLNEQLLVNEGQLATLLRLSRPGEEVVVSVFREGKSLDLKVILGVAKGCDGTALRRMLSESVMRSEDGATKIVNLGEKTARYSNEKGRAEVMRVSEGDSVRIFDPEGKLIYEVVMRGNPDYSDVPEGWRREISAMRRGLDHALSAKAVSGMRPPRPQIVQPEAPSSEE